MRIFLSHLQSWSLTQYPLILSKFVILFIYFAVPSVAVVYYDNDNVSGIYRLWRNMYHQFDHTMHPRQSVFKHVMSLSEQNKVLEKEIKELEAVSINKKKTTLIFFVSESGAELLSLEHVLPSF